MIFEFEKDKVVIADDMMMHKVIVEHMHFIEELAITIQDDCENMGDMEEDYSYTVGNVEVSVTKESIELKDLTAATYNYVTIDDEEDLTQLPNLFNMVVAQLEYDSPFDMELNNEPEISPNL